MDRGRYKKLSSDRLNVGHAFLVALKAEALHLGDRTSDALEAITETEALIERFENRYWCAELHRLRGVFLTAIGAEESQIEAWFCAAIRTAKEQKSVSLEKRAEATFAEYAAKKRAGQKVMDSDCLFDNFLQLAALYVSFNGQTNLSLRVGPNRERPLSVAVMKELMQASLVERHVASGLPCMANLLLP